MRRRLIPFLGASALLGVLGTSGPLPVTAQDNAVTRAAKGELRAARIPTSQGDRVLPTISAGTVFDAAQASRQAAAAPAVGAAAPAGVTRSSLGCGARNTSGIDIRVNQDCSYRLQGEEIAKFNPADPTNLVAGMNDERQGFNLNAFGYSFDRGKTWGDDPPPFYQKINNPAAEEPVAGDPNRHTVAGGPGNLFTYDGGSDPALAVDLEGRSFYGNIIFDRLAGNGAAVVVTQSPSGAGGSFYNNLPPFSRQYVVAEDNSLAAFHDKLFVTADIGANSPNRDNVYVTWTVFRLDEQTGAFLESPIYGSMSTDHAKTWSTPEEISGTSKTLCFFGNQFNPALDPHSCNFSQGSDPVTLANGNLEVIFQNGNTPAGNPNGQQLGVLCHPAGSSPAGTAHLHCGAPVKVGDDISSGEPACDFGRGPEECIPGTFVRTDDFPRIAVNRGNDHLYAVWQDFRTKEFDVHLSQSVDGGKTWTEVAGPVNPDRGKDHYEAAVDVVCSGANAGGNAACPTSGGSVSATVRHDLCPSASAAAANSSSGAGASDHVAVSYYRTCLVPNEAKPGIVFAPGAQPGVQAEPSDYTLSGGSGRDLPYGAAAVSPIFPPPDGEQSGFMGDYSGITVVGDVAHPIWSDPRVVIPAQFQADQGSVHDQDVYITSARVPSGMQDNQQR